MRKGICLMSREHRPPLRLIRDTCAETGRQRPAPHPNDEQDADPLAGLIVAAEVLHALGAASVMRMRADPTLREYVCPFCDLPGRIRHPTDPDPDPCRGDGQASGAASVVALRYVNGLTVVRFTHPECSPSAVLRILHDARPVRHRVRAACWLRPDSAATSGTGRGEGTAVLLVDNQVRAWNRTRARDAEEYYPKALRAAGFALWTDLDDVPPAVPGLTIAIDPPVPGSRDRLARGTEAVVRVAQGPAVVFEGCLDMPDDWAEAARISGRVLVVAGTALTDPGPVIGQAWTTDPDRLGEALAVAAHQGRAWAGQAAPDPAGHLPRPGAGRNPAGDGADSPQPETAIVRGFPGIGTAPDIPLPPNPAATARETPRPDTENVSAIRSDALHGTNRWPWSGYRARHSGWRRWA
jgi:hypothetical protein